MTSPDPMLAMVAFLKADTDVAALAGTRVYGQRMARSETDSQPRHAVVVQNAGGSGQGSYIQYHRRRFDVRCYGSSDAQAMALHQTVFDALKALYRATHSNTVLADAIAENVGFSLREPDTDWPLVFSTWSVGVHEVAAI